MMNIKPYAHPLVYCTLLLCSSITFCGKHPATAPEKGFPFFPGAVSLEQACIMVSRHLGNTASLGAFYQTLDSAANSLSRSLGEKKTTPDAVASILNLVYKSWNIQFDPRDTAIETLLPHLVYKNKKGACLGVSLIILMLAERLGCPLYGVMLPGHFFCRYDNGEERFNLEPNKSGFRHPDDYYRERYPVAGKPWYDLASLPNAQTIGMLCYNAGTLCLCRRQYESAVSYFREALCRIDGFAEAQGNLGLALAQAGLFDSSLAVFETLFTAYPGFVNLAANYGTVAIAAKQYDKALAIFKKGLEYFPEDTVLLFGLSRALQNATRRGPAQGKE
jgi:tetratricopeptide (TPR) repeat protein